jgi:hypothetical protein
MGARLRVLSVAVLAAAAGLAAGAMAGELPANTWVKLSADGLGPRFNPGLVYAPSLKKLVFFGGGIYLYPKDGPFPYDMLSSEAGSGKWRNEFPPGKNWGPEYGNANPPEWKSPYFATTDKEGNCRPHMRQAHAYHNYAVDPDSDCMWAVIQGYTMSFSFKDMTWQDLGNKEGPGAGTERPLQWGALAYDPVNKELVQFGGAGGAAQREGATTWLFPTAGKKWRKLEPAGKALDGPRQEADGLRAEAKDLLAAMRNRFHKTELAEKAKADLAAEAGALAGKVESLAGKLGKAAPGNEQEQRQVQWAQADLNAAREGLSKLRAAGAAVTPDLLKIGRQAEWSLLRARDALEAQPPPRLMAPMAYDPKSRKIVLFGGDRWDHLCAETWLYDPQTRAWAERRPAESPPPRAGHALLYLPGSGKVLLLGGYSYVTSMSYCPGLYGPLPFEMWTYDVAGDRWDLVRSFEKGAAPPINAGCWAAAAAASADDVVTVIGQEGHYTGKLSTWACRVDPAPDAAGRAKLAVKPGTVHRRGLSFDPEWFEDAPAPDEAAAAAKLAALPANKWVSLAPPKTLEDRCWGTQVLDPDRDQIIHWTGGHSSHCGTDPAHYSLKLNRWSTGFAPELAMEMTYDAGVGGTSPAACFTGRPFLPHTYQSYGYDPLTRKMYWTHQDRLWVYDLDRRDWEPAAKPTPFFAERHVTNLRATPHGLVVWTNDRSNLRGGLWLCADPAAGKWEPLAEHGKNGIFTSGCDGSGLVYDSRRDRMLMFHFGLKEKHQVCAYDFKAKAVAVLEPKGGDKFPASASGARAALGLPEDDLVMVPTPAKPDPLTLIYDAAQNEWLVMENAADRDKNGKLLLPDGYHVSLGTMWDPRRKLVWASDVRGNVFAMRFERKTAALQPLK